MKIIQINAVIEKDDSGERTIIYGLGDDNLVYFWDGSDEKWCMYDEF